MDSPPKEGHLYLIEAEINSMSTSNPLKHLVEHKIRAKDGREAYDKICAEAKAVQGWIVRAKVTRINEETGELEAGPPPAVKVITPKPCPLSGLEQMEVHFPVPIGIATKANTCEEASADDSAT